MRGAERCCCSVLFIIHTVELYYSIPVSFIRKTNKIIMYLVVLV